MELYHTEDQKVIRILKDNIESIQGVKLATKNGNKWNISSKKLLFVSTTYRLKGEVLKTIVRTIKITGRSITKYQIFNEMYDNIIFSILYLELDDIYRPKASTTFGNSVIVYTVRDNSDEILKCIGPLNIVGLSKSKTSIITTISKIRSLKTLKIQPTNDLPILEKSTDMKQVGRKRLSISSTTILDIPLEIITEIMMSVDDIWSRVSLMLTCKLMYSISLTPDEIMRLVGTYKLPANEWYLSYLMIFNDNSLDYLHVKSMICCDHKKFCATFMYSYEASLYIICKRCRELANKLSNEIIGVKYNLHEEGDDNNDNVNNEEIQYSDIEDNKSIYNLVDIDPDMLWLDFDIFRSDRYLKIYLKYGIQRLQILFEGVMLCKSEISEIDHTHNSRLIMLSTEYSYSIKCIRKECEYMISEVIFMNVDFDDMIHGYDMLNEGIYVILEDELTVDITGNVIVTPHILITPQSYKLIFTVDKLTISGNQPVLSSYDSDRVNDAISNSMLIESNR